VFVIVVVGFIVMGKFDFGVVLVGELGGEVVNVDVM